MLKSIGVKALYAPALAEGEGVGTAYEYFAKRLILRRWLSKQERPRQILIAGLPEKYGSSLDFFMLAGELNGELTVIDERLEALTKAEKSLAAGADIAELAGLKPNFIHVNGWEGYLAVPGQFDLILCSEVWQRLPADRLGEIWAGLRRQSRATAVFVPNADNAGHTDISGLSGLHLAQLQAVVGADTACGYIDMPPFPPGITRSEEQREQAESGMFEAAAMFGLGYYARLEHWLPTRVRRTQSHIVYAVAPAV